MGVKYLYSYLYYIFNPTRELNPISSYAMVTGID